MNAITASRWMRKCPTHHHGRPRSGSGRNERAIAEAEGDRKQWQQASRYLGAVDRQCGIVAARKNRSDR